MSSIFGKEYSANYDLLYDEKDYDSECGLIEKIIRDYSKIPVSSILDLGCGTGNHSLRLAEKGYSITGVDCSDEMLEIAREKARQKMLDVDFYKSDIRDFNDDKKYDAVIMMFAVLGYQLGNDDVEQALDTVKKHLKKGGVFICDVWYGPAVLTQKPGERTRIMNQGEKQIIRTSSGVLDNLHQKVDIIFHLWNLEGDRLISKTEEKHSMRFFFPLELAALFKFSGIHLDEIRAFPEWDREPDDDTWNIIAVGTGT